MSHNVPINQAGSQLVSLVETLGPNDEIVLTRDDQPVARILPNRTHAQRRPGNCKGMLIIHADDDEHLEHFKEYMP